MMEEEKKIDDADAIVASPPAVLPIDIQNLTFSYEMTKPPNIVGLNCVVQPNSKVILVGGELYFCSVLFCSVYVFGLI